MKNIFTLLAAVLLTTTTYAQIGINNETPDASAALDITSTTGGLLVPRMTAAERDAITSATQGLIIFCSDCASGEGELQIRFTSSWKKMNGSDVNDPIYPAGSVFCASGATVIVDVTNPDTGKTWMDRNLGASQVATSSTDADSYGDLYQWGRGSDGHQCRTSTTTTTLSSTDQPGNGNFIVANTQTKDWRSPQNANLWQGVNGVNNPCPSGYRLPTETELEEERLSWSSFNYAGAFGSPLKMPAAGYRNFNDILLNVGEYGRYWSSTVNNTNSRMLFFFSNNSNFYNFQRGFGFSVRCLKDY
ncbi:hypothetical protein N8229_05860 [Flavobacteriaceae bacterium]|nr:hypothetical protein [Flavobacteriaceae bacterium]